MSLGLRGLGFSAVLAWALAAGATSSATCYDAAVIAEPGRLISIPLEKEDPPDTIRFRWPWIWEIDVEKVVQGRFPLGPTRVRIMLHSTLRSDHALLFLRREEDGRYWVTMHSTQLVEDRRGRLIIPIAKPRDEKMLWPESWMPADYQKWLRPIRYRPRSASWLNRRFYEDDETGALESVPGEWGFFTRDRLVARRGLYVDDLPDMFDASRLCTHKPR